ncbi:hypothetical protein JCM10213_009322 [Rhodosporidiobolus nylandii]
MASLAPTLALVGATGLVGSALLSSFILAVQSGRLSGLRVLTSSPDSPKLNAARSLAGKDVEIKEVHYAEEASLEAALKDADVLVSAMGASETKEGKYEDNKSKLLEAAVKAGIKVYVPSEWGTDHNGENNALVQSPMFENKQHHHEEAQKRGLKVLSFYNGLLLQIAFTEWLGTPVTSPSPTWTIPKPSHPVAFTDVSDLGPFVLSAVLQTLSSSTNPSNVSSPIPSRLRIAGDVISLDEAADIWEKHAGGKVERVHKDQDELKAKYEEIKPTLPRGALGAAIPLMMSVGGFDHTKDSATGLLNTGDFAFAPKTVDQFLRERAEELKKVA